MHFITDHQKFLYHYTRLDTFIEHIFRTKSLRLSTFENLNDPRESKTFEFSVFGRLLDDKENNPNTLSSRANNFLKNQHRILSFSTDVESAIVANRDYFHVANHERGFSRPRMWAQYAGNHTGVCLVIDKEMLLAELKLACTQLKSGFHHGHVKYENVDYNRNPFAKGPFSLDLDLANEGGVDRYIDDHLKRYLSDIFFVKATDWQQEREWRCVVRGKFEGQIYLNISKALAGVIFGEGFQQEAQKKVLDDLEHEKIPVAKMSWANGYPQLRPYITGVWKSFA
jgi:Protein of unknown function (DUF2971)